MTLSRCLPAIIGLLIVCAATTAEAQTLPSAVQQKVAKAVSAWAQSGNAQAAGAAVADICNENPEIALDIVAYAGERAAKSGPSQLCLVSDGTCTELEMLLAVLYERAISVSAGSATVASQGPRRDAGKPPGSLDPAPPCQISGTCLTEPAPVSPTGLGS